VLLGLGFILNMNKEAIINWMYGYPQFEPLLNIINPVSVAINNISLQVSTILSQVSLYLQQMGTNLNYLPLILFGLLAAAQFVIYRRERTFAGK